MVYTNFTISEFLGIIIGFAWFIWLTIVIFDGFGIFKDIFYTSNRRPR